MKKRGFEVVEEYKNQGIKMPIRKTKYSAAYDVAAAADIVIPPYKPGMKPTLIPTGLKAYCQDDECFILLNRSSGPKKGFIMSNSIGLVDADYYNNESNEGHFFFQYYNFNTTDLVVKKGDIIGQVLFLKYLVTDNDVTSTVVRTGGFGSTDN